MSQISQIRSLVQDVAVRLSQMITVDGSQSVIQLDGYPIAGAVIITGTGTVPVFTVDTELGVITFATVPVAQDLTVVYGQVLLSDIMIQDMLDLEVDSADQLRLAAADALDAIASSQSLILKKIRLLDLQTDGPAVADSLRKHAKWIRDSVFNDEFQESVFDIAEQVNTSFDWHEKIRKDWLRTT